MRGACLSLSVAAMWAGAGAYAAEAATGAPGCKDLSPQQCVKLALDAMGGRERLQGIRSVRLRTIEHTALAEQSYRQEPFISSYETGNTAVDFAGQRVLREAKMTWPQADPNQAEVEINWVSDPEGCVRRTKNGDLPCSLGDLYAAREMLALGPEKLLLAAAQAADLHFDAPEVLRATPHAVVAFLWQKIPVRVLLNEHNHLPDAVETTQQFSDFWYFWGDVQQRVYWDNWVLFHGVVYPTNQVVERNGVLWRSRQALNVEFNVSLDEKAFVMDAEVARKSAASPGWKRTFRGDRHTELAPGVDLYEGAWNTTVVKQPDGMVILEAPISEHYMQGAIEEARKLHPGTQVKAVLSTSDSWPHTGGVRYAVAQGFTVYILDLNQPLLDRTINAPHRLDPDALEAVKSSRKPRWNVVSEKVEVGNGENRLELYPLRGASTERQYMVYFPQSRLLYASDTLALNEDGSLYDPELMREVAQAVERASIKVDTVFAMHQGPMAWSQVLAMVEKSRQP